MQKDNSTAALDFNPLELADVIYTSALSDGKKLAYLYMIADGSFSLSHFDSLLEDMDAVGEKLERQKKSGEKKLESLESKKAKLEEELMVLSVQAAEEQMNNSEILLRAMENEAEREQEDNKKEKLQKIKIKLNTKK